MTENPIYVEFFRDRAMLSGKAFDDYRSVQFRKQLLALTWLRETKPSSLPTAGMIERLGTGMNHHLLWLKNEGTALRESQTYRSPLRAVSRTRRSENAIKAYLNTVHSAIKRLKSLV